MKCGNCEEDSIIVGDAKIEFCTAGCGPIGVIKFLKSEQEMVEEFHVKNKFIIGESIDDDKHSNITGSQELSYLLSKLLVQVQSIAEKAVYYQGIGDERLYRVYLMLEELIEVIGAMAKNDEVGLADGLGDLLYVVLGTNVTYNIPARPIFDEIQRANMAKKIRDPILNPRMRDKGCGWKKPDIAGTLERSRKDVDS